MRPNAIRDAGILRLFDGGLTYAQIAELMGCSRGAVAGVISRSRHPHEPSPRTVVLREAVARNEWAHCGHPRTPENTQKVGNAGVRCKICRRRISLASLQRKRAA